MYKCQSKFQLTELDGYHLNTQTSTEILLDMLLRLLCDMNAEFN